MPRKKIAASEPEIPAEITVLTSPLTNDELVREHFLIEDYVKAESERFAEFLKPMRARDEEIKKVLHARMIEQGMPAIQTEHGTAYTSTIVSPKITDREVFLDLVLDERNYETFGKGLLQVGAPQKAAFDEYVERRKKEIDEYQAAHGGALPDDVNILPPGVETSSFTRVNIRRS